MRKLLAVFPVVILVLFSLSLWGCTEDDEDTNPVGPPAENCSIDVTEPTAGARFLPGAVDSQTVAIRWDETGPDLLVNIDLLKGGSFVANLVTQVSNSGFYSWRASNLGAEDGGDFSVRVSSDGTSGCLSSSEEFVLLNTIGCTIDFHTGAPDSVHTGDVVTLAWSSQDVPGLLSLELELRGSDPTIVATDLPAEGSYDWNVETFDTGTSQFYYLRLRDMTIPKYCFDTTSKFKIEVPVPE